MNCELCHSYQFKYQCPRCNIKYCSLNCYRSENHSQCSEAFYKECVMTELKSETCNPGDKKKMLELLEKFNNQDGENEEWEDLDSDDDETDADLADRLNEVDLNNADAIWERLTDAEREEFKTIVHNGDIDKIVEPVVPFWKNKLTDLVIEVAESEKKIQAIREKCPTVRSDIKDFKQISTKQPAKCVIYNIANVIASYSYIYRLYNGDHFSHMLEASNNFVAICDNLKCNANFEATETVLDSVILACHNNNLFTDVKTTKEQMYDDLVDIFNGPCIGENSKLFLLACSSDIITLLETAKTVWKKDIKSQEKRKRHAHSSRAFSSHFPSYEESIENFKELSNQTHIVGCLKKLEFYLSFLHHRYNNVDWNIELP